jgi:hypothetical protein
MNTTSCCCCSTEILHHTARLCSCPRTPSCLCAAGRCSTAPRSSSKRPACARRWPPRNANSLLELQIWRARPTGCTAGSGLRSFAPPAPDLEGESRLFAVMLPTQCLLARRPPKLHSNMLLFPPLRFVSRLRTVAAVVAAHTLRRPMPPRRSQSFRIVHPSARPTCAIQFTLRAPWLLTLLANANANHAVP